MKTHEGHTALRLRELNARAEQERTALAETLAKAAQRLRPARLASDAGDRVADAMLDTFASARSAAREHPLKAVGIAAMVGAVLARRPLSRLISQGLDSAWRHFRSRHQSDGTEVPVAEESEEPHGT